MSAIVLITAQIVLVLGIIAALVAAVSWATWKFVYYIVAPQSPIAMTAIISAGAIWCLSAAVIALA